MEIIWGTIVYRMILNRSAVIFFLLLFSLQNQIFGFFQYKIPISFPFPEYFHYHYHRRFILFSSPHFVFSLPLFFFPFYFLFFRLYSYFKI